MSQASGLGQLTSEEWQRLQTLLERFEAAWEAGEPSDWSAFLPATGDRLRATVLEELIKSDLEIRWRKGQPKQLEAYVGDWPELGNPNALVADLIHEEYRVRQQFGDRPALSSYQERFPEQYAAFVLMVQGQGSRSLQFSDPAPQSVNLPSSVNGLLPGGGGYRLISRIGSGGFGEVWRAEAPGGVQVAIKIILRPLDHAEAQRELEAVEIIKHLRHPFLLQTQAFWPLEDRLLMVMELCDGNLRDRLRECREAGLPGIPLADLLLYFGEAAEALDFLHEKQILHRDIKPDNILLLAGHTKVADFGLARILEGRRTAKTTGVGTPPYMPPEMWEGRVSEHSDQYSLAASYAELRLNRRLFPSRELRELMLDHLERSPELAPLSLAEQRVLLRAMAKQPQQRFPSCVAFVQALEQSIQQRVPDEDLDAAFQDQGKFQTQVGREALQAGHRRTIWLMILVILALIGLLGYVLSR